MDYGTSDTWEYRKGYDDGARDSQCLLGCVMHFVDKWLDGDELKYHEAKRASIMREKTLQIVEKLEKENAELRKRLHDVSASPFDRHIGR